MIINKFKAAIEPLQMWLLKSGRCVGCGKELVKSATNKKKVIMRIFISVNVKEFMFLTSARKFSDVPC